jgi:hypothetical protein
MKKPNGYWTKESYAEAALKFESRKAFRDEYLSADTIAQKKGWLDDICTHMKSPRAIKK